MLYAKFSLNIHVILSSHDLYAFAIGLFISFFAVYALNSTCYFCIDKGNYIVIFQKLRIKNSVTALSRAECHHCRLTVVTGK